MPGVEPGSKKHNVLSITCLPFHHILYVLMQINQLITKRYMNHNKNRQCDQLCKVANRDDKDLRIKYQI